jgi:phosphatidylserine synthase
MPITMNGVLIPLVYFAGIDPKWFPYIFLVLGFLMVSSLKVRRI